MDSFLSFIEFFGVIILLLGLGYLIGHFLDLDKFFKKK